MNTCMLIIFINYLVSHFFQRIEKSFVESHKSQYPYDSSYRLVCSSNILFLAKKSTKIEENRRYESRSEIVSYTCHPRLRMDPQ